MDIVRDQHRAPAGRSGAAQGHGFGGGGGLVQQAGVGHGQAGQVGDHGLEDQQALKAALADLGLVGRVLGVPAGILEKRTADHRRGDGIVIAQAEVAAEDLVLLGIGVQARHRLGLAERGRHRQRRGAADRWRDHGADERFQGRMADRGQHRRDALIVGSDMAIDEAIGVGQGGDGCGCWDHDPLLVGPMGWRTDPGAGGGRRVIPVVAPESVTPSAPGAVRARTFQGVVKQRSFGLRA